MLKPPASPPSPLLSHPHRTYTTLLSSPLLSHLHRTYTTPLSSPLLFHPHRTYTTPCPPCCCPIPIELTLCPHPPLPRCCCPIPALLPPPPLCPPWPLALPHTFPQTVPLPPLPLPLPLFATGYSLSKFTSTSLSHSLIYFMLSGLV